eukprot:4844067-Amphidinium_carterae.1
MIDFQKCAAGVAHSPPPHCAALPKEFSHDCLLSPNKRTWKWTLVTRDICMLCKASPEGCRDLVPL